MHIEWPAGGVQWPRRGPDSFEQDLMPTNILRAKGLVKRVPTAEGELTILAGIDFAVDAGDQVAVVGESGSGKTTLLGILAGLDLPTLGDVWLDGDEITALGEEQRARVRARSVGFVFQTFQLIDSLTALENVMLPLGTARRPPARRRMLGGSSTESVSALGPRTIRVSCPAANSSAWRSPGRSRRGQRCSSPTSQQATSTPTPVRGSRISSSI